MSSVAKPAGLVFLVTNSTILQSDKLDFEINEIIFMHSFIYLSCSWLMFGKAFSFLIFLF